MQHWQQILVALAAWWPWQCKSWGLAAAPRPSSRLGSLVSPRTSPMIMTGVWCTVCSVHWVLLTGSACHGHCCQDVHVVEMAAAWQPVLQKLGSIHGIHRSGSAHVYTRHACHGPAASGTPSGPQSTNGLPHYGTNSAPGGLYPSLQQHTCNSPPMSRTPPAGTPTRPITKPAAACPAKTCR